MKIQQLNIRCFLRLSGVSEISVIPDLGVLFSFFLKCHPFVMNNLFNTFFSNRSDTFDF